MKKSLCGLAAVGVLGCSTPSSGIVEDGAADAGVDALHDGAKIYPNERKDDYKTIWECYSAEAASPCTRWDDTYHGRQDFVGWSGLGPIALLIEQVLGFEIRGAENRVVWNLTRTDRHGVERMQVGPNNVVSIIASARGAAAGPTTIQTEALRSFTLEVILPNQPPKVISVCAGTQVHELH